MAKKGGRASVTQKGKGVGSTGLTKQKRAESKLKALSQQMEAQLNQFESVMSSLPDFVYHFDLEGRFTYANQSLLDLLEKTREEVVGRNFHDLDYPPELATRLQQQIQEVIKTGRPLKDETPYTSALGARQYEYLFSPLPGKGKVEAVAGVTRDITERVAGEQQLRHSEERFRLLVDGARDYAIFQINLENKIIYWSAGAERNFGWTAEEALGQPGRLIFTPEDRAIKREETEMRIALKEGCASDRRWHIRKDGTRIWVDGVMRRLDDAEGNLRGFAKIARDATEERAAEEDLRRARDELELRVEERTRDLTAINRELERTMAERQMLEKELLEISEREKRRIGEDLHDIICQELTATALFLKSRAKNVEAESPDAAATLEESAQIVNRNVGLARDLARGLQPADLKGAGLKRALHALADQACEKGEMKCHFRAARGVRVTDDTIALHLYRVAQEAVNNAVKHSGAKNLLIVLDKNTENVCVTVEDDGKGFSPRRRSKGLGLHIMRYRANALGGHLKIEKRKRGGMQITCVIPVKQ
ncbi:MAG: PAS domain S-box protein [Chthoniobacterales bacterium]